jgi:cobalamin biosynthesis protein CobD/CbiB
VWRALRRLGAAQVLDGLVALPADSRTREQLEWLADSVIEAGGQATVWLAQPASRSQERAIAAGMQAEISAEYERLTAQAAEAQWVAGGARKRTLGRLRRELRRIRRRDYFRAPQGAEARAAVEALAASGDEVAA